MTHGKCAYCECILGSGSHTEIDHYIAKTVDGSRVFEWTNLFPVCGPCNRTKGNQNHQGRMVKPDAHDPEPYFWLDPLGQIEPHPALDPASEERVRETIRLCGLGRPGLRRARYFTMQMVKEFVLGQGLPDWVLDPGVNHKFVIRFTLRDLGRDDLAEEDRRRFR
jgi:uncharacterized protein (TIGR02646 family)